MHAVTITRMRGATASVLKIATMAAAFVVHVILTDSEEEESDDKPRIKRQARERGVSEGIFKELRADRKISLSLIKNLSGMMTQPSVVTSIALL